MSEANGNAADYFIERHLREGRGERLAFTDPWRSLSYAQLSDASARFAAGLAKTGIERERRIALLMLDTIDFPIAFWGALRAGIVPVPINTLLPAEITEYILRDSRAAALVVSAPLLEPQRAVLDRLPALRNVIVSQPNGELPRAPNTTAFAAFPDSAASVLIPDRPTPDLVLETMGRFRPTIFAGVPTLYAALLAHPKLERGGGSDRLRRCLSAGEPLPEHVGRRWRETVGVDILDGLGSTEMLHIFLSNRPDDIRYGTTGKAVPGYELRVVTESGEEAVGGESGELIVKGPSAAEGYWNQRDKSRRTFRGEWTYTGDTYIRDADGYYRYCGRSDDMLKVSGIWVSPFEVEEALIGHTAVLEAAVVGHLDPEGLIKPKAFVVLQQSASGHAPAALVEALQDHVKAA